MEYNNRKKWVKKEPESKFHMNVPAVKEEILPQYEEYLLLLQERNKLLKKLRRKDRKQVQIERKEKGFSLYINGANTELSAPATNHTQRVKTATESRNPAVVKLQGLRNKSTSDLSKKRAKTAPARERRRNWDVSSVDITTTEGNKHRLKAPDILSGKYEDDFEEIDSDSESVDYNSESDGVGSSVSSSTTSSLTPRRQKTSYLKRKVAALREEEHENTLMLSVADVHKLRKSLELDTRIRHSVCQDVSSISSSPFSRNIDKEVEVMLSDEEEIPEEIGGLKDESENDRASTISEEDEIEEDLAPAFDSISLESNNKKQQSIPILTPGDTVVLEFAPPLFCKARTERSLMAARKKEDVVSNVLPSSTKSASLALNVRKSSSSPDVTQLKSGTPKAKQPLSAGRRNTNSKEDSTEEASAVLKAMQEENQKADHYAKSARPLPLPGVKNQSNTGQLQVTPALKSTVKTTEKRDGSENDRIASIVKRILTMAPKNQRDLMKTLSKIDDCIVESTGTSNMPVKATAPVADMVNTQKGEEHVEVSIEILSNWGHSSRVGLTEIQMLSTSGQLLPVPASGVSAKGAHSMSCLPTILFNGRAKTTKERNMWSCQWTGQKVELVMKMGKVQIAALRLWNWNKNISELDVGVRHVQIFLRNDLVFDGEIDKGCGNHIFDYSKRIEVPVKSLKSPVTPNKNFSLEKNPSKGGSPPHSPLPATSSSLTTRGLVSPLKGENPTVPNDGYHHTFRSISRSSASSASSSGSLHSHRNSQSEEKGQVRGDTRTLVRPSSLAWQHSAGSDHSSPDNDPDIARDKLPEKNPYTPRTAQRFSPRLDVKSSDTETSHSNADSFEHRPPLPPDKMPRKSIDRMSKSSEKLTPKASVSEPILSPRSGPMSSQRSSSGQVEYSISDKQEKPLLEQLKDMSNRESKRRKEFPQWLASEDLKDSEFKGKMPDKHDNLKTKNQSNIKNHSRHKKEEEEDIVSLLDEEFAMFSNSQKTSLPSAPKIAQSPEKSKTSNLHHSDEDADTVTPMKRIEKNRSKWRNKQTEDLEETWSSLSFFNKSHRGRISMDMGDDILDECLTPKKQETVAKLQIPDKGLSDASDDSFVIPELPSGKELVLKIVSTWGDRHYVGLTSIQVFSSTGDPVQIKKITADPPDINILPEYGRDPRVVGNILDGVNRTRDDTHMWLAPFTPGKSNFVYMTFAKHCSIALIRIWNYNKSRIHSYRGAKDIVMTLDGTIIFQGEITRAIGGIEGGTEAFGDTILFTTDEEILEAVSKNDDAFEGELLSDSEDDVPFQRPSTADNQEDDEDRPFTRAAGLIQKTEKGLTQPTTNMMTYAGDIVIYKTRKIELNFKATWGDLHYLGLTALEVVGKDGEALALNMTMLSAQPRDVRHLRGHENDDRTLDKLIDGTSITMSDEHMWLVPFTEGQNHTVTITFPQETLVSGLRIWNYNKSPEDTYRGAKIMHISINDHLISPPEGFLVRKGPGNCHFDFAQEINFTDSLSPRVNKGKQLAEEKPSQSDKNYESVQMPSGFIFQIQLFSTWGDLYYVGLNGLEFYDASFNKITLTQSNISAYPDSVNVLEHIKNDVRTPDKLIDGENDTMDGRHMWLAPILPGMLNRVYIIFDQPTTVSMIKIWNYSKTPQRGVKDFALLVDDLLVYNGMLQAVSGSAQGKLPTKPASPSYFTILFTDNADVLHREKYTVINNQPEDQDVQLLNDKKIVTKHADPNKANAGKPVNQALRPKTGVTGMVKKQR